MPGIACAVRDEDQLLTSKDVARILCVSSTTALSVMRRAGAINVGCGKHTQRLRIMESSLHQYLDSRFVKLKEPRPSQMDVLGKKQLTRTQSAEVQDAIAEGRRLPWSG